MTRIHVRDLDSLLGSLQEVGDKLLEKRALLKRTDSKFLAPTSKLPEIIDRVQADYGLLRAGGNCLATYNTLYFDTPELRCFHDHRRGVRARHKVRVRHYADRELTFLEIKTKRSERITSKRRLARRYGDHALCEEGRRFVAEACDIPGEQLEPQVWTNFKRVTLVGMHTNERVTIDFDLCLQWSENRRDLSNVMIVEVKQHPFSTRTPIMQALREAGLRPASASKYCVGIVSRHPGIRHGRLRPTLRAIERISQ